MKANATKTRKSRASVEEYIVTARLSRDHIKMINSMDCMFCGTPMEIFMHMFSRMAQLKVKSAGTRIGRKSTATKKNMPDSSSQLATSKNEAMPT